MNDINTSKETTNFYNVFPNGFSNHNRFIICAGYKIGAFKRNNWNVKFFHKKFRNFPPAVTPNNHTTNFHIHFFSISLTAMAWVIWPLPSPCTANITVFFSIVLMLSNYAGLISSEFKILPEFMLTVVNYFPSKKNLFISRSFIQSL